jgi:hypothetical protein
MSPLSAMAGVGAGAVGMFTPGPGGTTPWQNLKTALGTTNSAGAIDLGGGLIMRSDGSIAGGTSNSDSGLSNDDLYARTLGYENAADMYRSQGGVARDIDDISLSGDIEDYDNQG